MSAPGLPTQSDDAVYEKKIRRRNYCKNMKRIYREEAKQERAYLLSKLAELERVLVSRRRCVRCNSEERSMLAWRDVALCLRDEHVSSKTKNHKLRAQLAALNKVMFEMQSWVVTNAALQFTEDGFAPTWQDHTLLSNPKSRDLGKAWITQQMYHQVDRIFHRHGFPSPDNATTPFFNLSVGFPDHRNSVSHQFIYPLPLNLLSTIYQRHFCEVAMMDTSFEDARVGRLHGSLNSIRETTDTTLLHQATRPIANSHGDLANILTYHRRRNDSGAS
ncbi:hypothetical protein, variant 7 [Aphanomyces invadans]|uniref:BZIP domain-containing protein n=1 Tax=Aphanomyces invadans TaxID=157072 RepID=A0A024TB39_9STRA|nr:hypothetical protein, variant 3 [Aphanomyces invadans]XP_008880059.1 hypothetical protein, variant 4 [Aphanomyces invadans]XP_008880060.1 hypothetical protein, variant 5 [Aphanomyces invadans]XP_008880061.1 hypothetical protein, variant 6 [Aphanomyces invadans]XP_008880062.1 hypothetical protein, variant 7 [Aphanomyces invadans]ETV91221.1 hypothetical protein, variant 3 [Aphanomyces invadans]ETV91222.1 hypothetical protein, variant 4 [Aphanomyces invadans]ETV91223.1 hypothetical protein, |eukprot:XP_008880058.1 hypothetical protein, variant 3 [Aphanomyces invadans]